MADPVWNHSSACITRIICDSRPGLDASVEIRDDAYSLTFWTVHPIFQHEFLYWARRTIGTDADCSSLSDGEGRLIAWARAACGQ